MKKLPCASQNTEAKTLSADVCIFGHFGHLLLSTQLTTDLTLEWNGGSMFHPLSHIYTKSPFVALKQLQILLWIVDVLLFLIVCEQMRHPLWTQLSCKMVNTLPFDIFNSSAISCYFNLQSAKTSLWSFLVFSGTTAEFGWPECSASFVSVQLHFKSEYHLLTIVSKEQSLNNTYQAIALFEQ